MGKYLARWHTSIEEIKQSDWEDLGGAETIPFYQFNWLSALERSGSVSKETGWQPLHLSLWKEKKQIAFAPLYLKAHSYGEFVFDQAFARLAEDLGLNYYPKLIGMSPFSPVEGYKFFISSTEDEAEVTKFLMQIIDAFAIKNNIISCNFLYVDPSWCPLAESAKCSKWLNQNSIWCSQGNKNFSDYLSSFNANQRRNIKKERKKVKDAGLTISAITGAEITGEVMHSMHDFYQNHCARWGPWGSKYLSKSFFQELTRPELRDQLVLFNAYRDNPRNPIAMSLCLNHGDMLWGRYWGSKEEINCLHFEVCYYSPINWALENGVTNFDPGAGGSHKRRRGFLAKPHTSLHRWYDIRMESLIKAWLPKVNDLMLQEISASNAELPFSYEPPSLSFVK